MREDRCAKGSRRYGGGRGAGLLRYCARARMDHIIMLLLFTRYEYRIYNMSRIYTVLLNPNKRRNNGAYYHEGKRA